MSHPAWEARTSIDEKYEHPSLYQHVRVQIPSPPCIKTQAVGWQMWYFAQEGSGDKIHASTTTAITAQNAC